MYRRPPPPPSEKKSGEEKTSLLPIFSEGGGGGDVCTQASILETFSNHNSLDQPPFPKQRGYQARVTQGTPFCHDRTITGKHQPRVGACLIRTQARFCTILHSLDFRTSVRFSLLKKPPKSERSFETFFSFLYLQLLLWLSIINKNNLKFCNHRNTVINDQ